MQIPRGTFRALKRGCSLQSLIQDLSDSAFSGYCRIALNTGSSTLVFKKGNIQLAEYDDLEGDAALDKIRQSGTVIVDAVLHDLSPAQFDLAMEFSQSSVVKSEKKMARVPDQQERNGVEKSSLSIIPDSRKTDLKERIPANDIRSIHQGSPNNPAETHVAGGGIPQIQTSDDYASLLSRELDTLDAMDIESMSEKFRASCRIIMERLELDHLIDQNSGKDTP
jgi:hypothetical protein